MKRALVFLILMSGSVGCKDNEYVSAEVGKTPCVSSWKGLRREGKFVHQAPVLLIKGRFYYLAHLDSTNVDLKYASPHLPCNLPMRFQQDSILALVSGYHLSNDVLDKANSTPIPFELTDIKPMN